MKKLFILCFSTGQLFNGITQVCNPLDSTFKTNGQSIGFSIANWLESRNILVQPDNKIIQLGTVGSNVFTIIRYKASGGLDSSFGQNGNFSVAVGQFSRIAQGALQADGKIVVAGMVNVQTTYNPMFALLRLNSNGTPDNSFGTGGIVTSSFSTFRDEALGVAIQADGKIVVVGSASGSCITDCSGYNFCKPLFTVVRYYSNGVPDSSFGQNGKVAFGIGSFNSGYAKSVVIQPDGKIVVAGERHSFICDWDGSGTYPSGFFMTRFQSNGTTDSSFGQNGQVHDTLNLQNTSAIALQPDGKFVVAGNHTVNGQLVQRYNANGGIDSTFNSISIFIEHISDVLITPGGKIVVAGNTWPGPATDFFIGRFQNDGLPDSSFNITGMLQLHAGPVPNSQDYATGIALQGNQIVVGGNSRWWTGSPSNTNYMRQSLLRLSEPLFGITVPISPAVPLYPCPGSGANLTTSAQGGYQWYKNYETIAGATGQSYIAITSGLYSVRVTNANGCGLSKPVTVAFNGLPVYIAPVSTSFICQGDSVKLKSSETGLLQWYFNNTAINGAIDTVFWAKANGSYYVSVNNAKGCGTSGAIWINVNPAKPAIIWNGTVLSTENGFANYEWYLDGNLLPAVTTSSFIPVATGIYKVIVSGFPCSTVSNEFNLNCSLAGGFTPTITWAGTVLVAPTGYPIYQWYLNNNAIPGAVSNMFYPQQTGVYKIEIPGKLGCINTSNDYSLTCSQAGPPTPPISWNGNQFGTLPGYSSYQWYYNDTAITGANSFVYTPEPTKFGRYKVEVTNTFDCSKFSEERYYAPTQTVNVGLLKISVYPNPASNIFYIDLSQPGLKTMSAFLYDLNGKVLLRQTLRQGLNEIYLRNVASGLYQLEISNGTEKTQLKILVMK